MINKMIEEKEIVKILRAMIITQLELKEEQVLNVLSFRGADLRKNLEEFTSTTFNQKDLVIVFELLETDSTNNITYTQDNDSLLIYASYKFDLSLYGNSSGLKSKVLRARILTDEVLTDLEQKGIHIYNVSYPSSGTEFINNVIWERKDMYIELSVKYESSKILTSNEFESINSINTIDVNSN